MRTETVGLIIGGLLPALLYGATGIFSKSSTSAGIGIGPYLIIIGLIIAVTGVGFSVFLPDANSINWRSGLFAMGVGLTWGLGTGLVAVGLLRYKASISQLVPLYNMNTLVVVLLSLWIFSEWKTVSLLKLLVGTFCIVVGGILVSVA